MLMEDNILFSNSSLANNNELLHSAQINHGSITGDPASDLFTCSIGNLPTEWNFKKKMCLNALSLA